MKELKNASENGNFNLSKVVRQIVIAVIVLILFAILFATGQIIFLIQIFSWIEIKVRAFTGLDTLLAKGLAALIMGGLLALPLWTFFFSFLPVPQKNKKGKRLIVMSIFALMFVASFFASQRVYFNPDSGKPMKYYSISPDGEYKFYSSDGYDPVTGDKLQPVTKDIAVKRFNKKKAEDNKLTAAQRWYEKYKRLSKEEEAAIEAEKVRLERERLKLEKDRAVSNGKSLDNSESMAKYKPAIKSDKTSGIIMPTVVTLSIKNPSGIEKTADFYNVKVINDLDYKVFFFVSAKIESDREVLAFPLPAKSYLNIDICEGNHYFGLINVNGKPLIPNSLKKFYSCNNALYFYINGERYRSDYGRIISVPDDREILLSDSN